MLQEHQVLAECGISSFFRPLAEGFLMQSTPPTATKPCQTTIDTMQGVFLPRVVKVGATQRPRLPGHHPHNPHLRQIDEILLEGSQHPPFGYSRDGNLWQIDKILSRQYVTVLEASRHCPFGYRRDGNLCDTQPNVRPPTS